MKKRVVQQNSKEKRSATQRRRKTPKNNPSPRPSIIPHLPDYQEISLSESGCLTFGTMKKYTVPEYFLAGKHAVSDAPQKPKSPSGYTNIELVTAASKGIEHCESVMKMALGILDQVDWEATSGQIEPWEVKAFQTESQIAAMTEKLCEYVGSRAVSGSTDAVQSLVKLAESCIERLDKSPESILKAVAKRRATYPVMFGGLPEHRKSAEDKINALKLGTETAVRAWNKKSGRPFSLETPANALAASLITYIEEVRSRKPTFDDTPLTKIADLPEELLKQIFALPELDKEPNKWAYVSISLLRNSGLRLAEIKPLLSLGLHRVKNKSSPNCSREAAITNLEDGIRNALKQAFQTLARRPKS